MTRMIIRRATERDLDDIVELAVESVSRNPLPVRISRGAMKDTLRTLLGPAHFLWVTEIAGRIEAAVGACVQPSFWYERLQCSVLLYFGRVRGSTAPLLREFARWVKGRPAIKVAVIELEPDADPRLSEFLQRLGFGRLSMNHSFVRGAA